MKHDKRLFDAVVSHHLNMLCLDETTPQQCITSVLAELYHFAHHEQVSIRRCLDAAFEQYTNEQFDETIPPRTKAEVPHYNY